MAVRTIATDLTLTGEKEFNDQMKAVNSNLKNLKSDMAATTAEFKGNADSAEALAAKNKILQETADQQREKVRALAAMHEKMAQTYGEDSAAADKYRQQLNYARAALAKTEEQLNDAAEAQEDFGDATEKASKSNISLGKVLPATAKGFAAIGAAAGAVVLGLLKLEEETAEYRENQAKLNTAFEAAGYSAGTAESAYNSLYSVLGDSDTATESAQLLAQLATSTEDVASWGDIAAGVVGTFGDALPINSLIEASNETAKVGQVTGALADALNWVGLSEDEFNAKLAACGSEQERNALITDTLTAAYGDAAAAFKTNNAEIIAANEAQAQMDATLAKLSGAVSSVKNKLIAEFLPSISDVVGAFVDFTEGAEGADVALQESIQNMVDNIVAKLPEFLDFGIDLIVAIASGIIQNLPYLISRIPTIIGEILKGFGSLGSSLVKVGEDMIRGLWQGITDMTSWLWNKVTGWLSGFKGLFTGKSGFDTHSPSKWSEDVFENVMLGGISGIDTAAPKLRKAFGDTVAQLKADAEGIDGLGADFNISGRLVSSGDTFTEAPAGRIVNLTVNTTSLSQSEVDYLIRKVNQELGRAV